MIKAAQNDIISSVIKMKILAIGEIIFDIFGNDAEIGGAPLNFCAHSAAEGAESALISAVGNDPLAFVATEKIRSFRVRTDFIKTNDYPTGKCIVTLKNGAPYYDVISPAAYDFIEADTEKIKSFSPDIFAFGTLIQRSKKSRETLKSILSECSFSDVFCDINLRKNCYDKESCLRCLENATILKISKEEEPLLNEFAFYEKGKTDKEIIKNICNSFKNIKLLLFTCGENGSTVYDAKAEKFYCFEAEKAETVSTVGAGDSYCAAFICEYFKSRDIEKAGRAGSKLSAYVVSHKEAVPKK